METLVLVSDDYECYGFHPSEAGIWFNTSDYDEDFTIEEQILSYARDLGGNGKDIKSTITFLNVDIWPGYVVRFDAEGNFGMFPVTESK